MVNDIPIYKRDTKNIIVNVTYNLVSSKNTTFTSTTAVDATAWDLSQVVAGMTAYAEEGSTGKITNVNDGTETLTVASWVGGTPNTGERVTLRKLPVDITGFTFFFTAKKNADDVDADAVITKDVDSHIDATNGQTKITLSTSDTDIDVGDYYYDIEMKDGGGLITTFLDGTLTIMQDITIRTS